MLISLFNRTTLGFPVLRTSRSILAHKSFLRLYERKDDDTKQMVEVLLGSIIRRAQSTINTSSMADTPHSNNVMLPETSSARSISNQEFNTNGGVDSIKSIESLPKLMYRGNPAITNTALAHSLWSSILHPNVDTAIDATCGNGHDSLALAQLLFPSRADDDADSLSRLICIDIQERACENTRRSLAKDYGDMLDTGQIQVLHKSHSPLPIDWVAADKEQLSVALVVYNLGWLPSNTETSKDDCITQMDSTLYSMVDAMLLLRIGGMLSVVTYPKTNAQEDVAVRTFMECAALLSSNVDTWQDFLETKQSSTVVDGGISADVAELVMHSMERLVHGGDTYQTWRVSEHKKLGMDRAPILLTATRIK